ncbi:MAG: alpha-galactosidase [Acidobacteria bacterium]|nr:alpha-galactosidase [Acidobacteriota bacterium]
MKLLLATVACTAPLLAQFHFDPEQSRWTLSNGRIQAVFQLTPLSTFEFQSLRDLRNGDAWLAPMGVPTSPIRLRLDDRFYGAQTLFRLVDHSVAAIPGGQRQTILLEDSHATALFRLDLELYADQPVLRTSLRVRNLQSRPARVRLADMLPLNLDGAGETFLAFRVTQWNILYSAGEFQPQQTTLKPDGPAFQVLSGARGRHCGWLAVRDESRRGLFAGWEFDGRAAASVSQVSPMDYVRFSAQVQNLNHPLQPGQEFQVPPAFLGLFRGDWDEAGYRTQSFVEAVLAKPAPDPDRFPYVGWDSWGYLTNLHEDTLRREAELAARLGIELFIVDLGWARSMGDWYADPKKFPSGLRALSDYVHSLGMKFGLHFTIAEAVPDSPVLRDNPDWTSSEQYFYHGAVSLCLSHQPVKEWVIEQAVRIIDDYGVDWILQDGENMVKECTKTTHTHDPLDSNYSNAVHGLNAVIAEIQRRRPQVHWENCENGGNMMTFNMVRFYVTSITNDASGALGARRGVFGATYPFSPRYTDRYMPEQRLDTYTTRSYMFGGPWLFMNRLTEMQPDDLALAASEVQLYQSLRSRIRNGKVFHLSAWPDEDRIEAIQSYDAASDTAVAFVTRHDSDDNSYTLRLRGLRARGNYLVRFEGFPSTLTMTGAQLLSEGVLIPLPLPRTTEIIHAEPLQ